MTDYEEGDTHRADEYREGGERSLSPEASYDRRSVSPRRDDRDDPESRDSQPGPRGDEEDDPRNEGTNLFVTGISKSITEEELRGLFAKFGTVDKCQVMMDPHTRESRGFGFVNMADVIDADKAVEELTGQVISGRTLSVEKARRKRPRTPTPGKYYGPRKVRRGGGRPRFDDRFRDRRDYPRYEDRRFDDRAPRFDDPYRRPRFDDRERYYRDRERGGSDRYRTEDRERYPPRDGRDRYDRRYSREDRIPPHRDERGPPRDDRLPPREDRLPPREDRLPPRDIRDERPFRDDRDRYPGPPPPASDSYRERDDYH